MGIFKSIGKAIKGVAKVAKFAAPFIPGVGPLAAAGIGAASGLLSGGGVKGAAQGAAAGGFGKLAGGMLSRIGRPSQAASAGGLQGIMSQIRGGNMPGTTPQVVPGAPPDGGQSLFGRIGGAIAKNPMQAAQIGLAGLSTLQGAQAQSRANQISQQALQQLQGDQANRNQLQQMVMQRLMAQGGGANPFGRV